MTATSPLEGNPNCDNQLNVSGSGGSFRIRDGASTVFSVDGSGNVSFDGGEVVVSGAATRLRLTGNLDSNDVFAQLGDGVHGFEFSYFDYLHPNFAEELWQETGQYLRVRSATLRVETQLPQDTGGPLAEFYYRDAGSGNPQPEHAATLRCTLSGGSVEETVFESDVDLTVQSGGTLNLGGKTIQFDADYVGSTPPAQHVLTVLKQRGTTLLRTLRETSGRHGDSIWIQSRHEGKLVIAADPTTAPQIREIVLVGDPVRIGVDKNASKLLWLTEGPDSSLTEYGQFERDASDNLELVATKSLHLRCDASAGSEVTLGFDADPVVVVPHRSPAGLREVAFRGAGTTQMRVTPASGTDSCEVSVGIGPQTRGQVLVGRQTLGATKPGVYVLTDDQGNLLYLSAWFDSPSGDQELWVTAADPGSTKPTGAPGQLLLGAL